MFSSVLLDRGDGGGEMYFISLQGYRNEGKTYNDFRVRRIHEKQIT